jgi:DNA-directed RNA polymerase subunit omega
LKRIKGHEICEKGGLTVLYPSINVIREKADSRYTLVILAAKRARDLIEGKAVLTEEDTEKPVSIAAYEIAEDLITYKRES